MEEKRAVTMDKLVNLCKGRGIIFPGSDIYGGMGNTWDYGPVGVEIKNNLKKLWWIASKFWSGVLIFRFSSSPCQ